MYILNVCQSLTCSSKTCFYPPVFNSPLDQFDSKTKLTVQTCETFDHFARCLTLGTVRRGKLNCETKTGRRTRTKRAIVARWKTVTR